ncbi:MAG: choice-of-anchor J domain-containing protein [Crocinitomicaceae bacterium]|nr:choice-of-anchor J domain-containing protein [Crocinitomicaceae bacterium]
MKKLLCVACVCLLSFGSIFSQAINEGFSNVSGLTAAGWNQQNLSTPIGVNPNWVQGDPVNMPFSANSLPANSYIAVNYNSVAGAATISNWLISPMLNLNNGDVITFYTRGTGSIYADNLQVRLSTNGSSTNVGASNISVGDFSNLLLEINPTLTAALYPAIWTQYTITISGLAAPTTGRIAFRYYVPNGGPTGLNSDLIGIDDFVYTPVPPCNLTATASANNAMGGAPNGSINLTVNGGTAPYSFMWNNGQTTQNATMLPPGCYTVAVVDATGCQSTVTACVMSLLGPILYSNSNVVSSYQVVNGGFTPQWVCQNDTLYTDGGIMKIYLESGATMITGGGIDTIYAKTGATIVMSGGIHVIYHEPGVNLVMNGGIPTLYPCPSLVFNYSQAPANGCAPVPVCNLTASTTISNIDCNGQASGSASANVLGGVAPLTYAWSNGATSQTVNNLPSGTYTVTITDANGCIITENLTITEPVALVGNSSVTNPILCAGGMATVSVSATGGTAPYAGTGSFSLSAGPQTYTVTDANGCSSTTTVTITEPTPLSAVTTSTDEMMGMDGTATVTVTGGTPSYMFYWMPGGATTASITGLASGTYTVMVLDANGCGDTLEVVVGSQVSLDEAGLSSLVLYPNPSVSTITVSNSASTAFDEVGIYTLEGRLLFEFALGGNESRILDISSWSPGRYVLKHASGVLPLVKL